MTPAMTQNYEATINRMAQKNTQLYMRVEHLKNSRNRAKKIARKYFRHVRSLEKLLSLYISSLGWYK
jgi:hypothetical protein